MYNSNHIEEVYIKRLIFALALPAVFLAFANNADEELQYGESAQTPIVAIHDAEIAPPVAIPHYDDPVVSSEVVSLNRGYDQSLLSYVKHSLNNTYNLHRKKYLDIKPGISQALQWYEITSKEYPDHTAVS